MEIFAKWIYKKLEGMRRKPDRILYNRMVREDLQTLEPAGDTPKRQKEYVVKKLTICSIIVFAGVILSFALWIKEAMTANIVDNRIDREEYGGSAKSVSLVANDGVNNYDIPVTIEPRQYTNDELLKLAEEVIPVLEKSVLGENKDFDNIAYDIQLARQLDGYPFDVEWRVDNEYIDYDGRLVKDKVNEPELVELTAVLSNRDFELEHTMILQIHSKAIQPDTAELLAKKVQDMEVDSRVRQNMTLPSEISNQSIKWSYKKSYVGLLFLAVTPMLALVVYYGSDRDLHMQVVNREEQMRMDYPEIVCSLALMIGAGMTVPNAWNKIARDYKARKEQGGAPPEKRYAYEEMLFAVYEMESGVVQTAAYERFGRRCRIPDYNRLSTMLSQNIRKGASNLPQMLKEEAADAFDEKKHMVRKMGEKAGTKLLVPMMLLLGITMLIIMVPAFKTYL